MVDDTKEVLVAALARIVVPVAGFLEGRRQRQSRSSEEIAKLRREVAVLSAAAARDRRRIDAIVLNRPDVEELAMRVQTLEEVVGEHYPAATGTLPIRPIRSRRRTKAAHATTPTPFDVAYPEPKAAP